MTTRTFTLTNWRTNEEVKILLHEAEDGSWSPVLTVDPEISIGAVNLFNVADVEINPATEDTLALAKADLDNILTQLGTGVKATPPTAGVAASVAYATSLIIKNAAGTLISVFGYNSKATAQFIQLHDSAPQKQDMAPSTLQNATTGTGNGSAIALDAKSEFVMLAVSGGIATVIPEHSFDADVTWETAFVEDLVTGVAALTGAITVAAGVGRYRLRTLPGVNKVRARISALVSGSITVTATERRMA